MSITLKYLKAFIKILQDASLNRILINGMFVNKGDNVSYRERGIAPPPDQNPKHSPFYPLFPFAFLLACEVLLSQIVYSATAKMG